MRSVDRRPAVALHIGVKEVKAAVGVAEVGRPDAAGIRISAHVELARAVSGRATSRQFARSREWWIWTPETTRTSTWR